MIDLLSSLGLITWDMDPVLLRIGDIQLRYYGVFFALALAVGYYTLRWRYKDEREDPESATNLTYALIAAVVIGATESTPGINETAAPEAASSTASQDQQTQQDMAETAANDPTLMREAQQRAKSLVENYFTTLGDATGRNYTIQWVLQDVGENAADAAQDTPAP